MHKAYFVILSLKCVLMSLLMRIVIFSISLAGLQHYFHTITPLVSFIFIHFIESYLCCLPVKTDQNSHNVFSLIFSILIVFHFTY